MSEKLQLVSQRHEVLHLVLEELVSDVVELQQLIMDLELVVP